MAKKSKSTRKTIKNGNYLLPIGSLFSCTGTAFLILSLLKGLEDFRIIASLLIVVGFILLCYNIAVMTSKK